MIANLFHFKLVDLRGILPETKCLRKIFALLSIPGSFAVDATDSCRWCESCKINPPLHGLLAPYSPVALQCLHGLLCAIRDAYSFAAHPTLNQLWPLLSCQTKYEMCFFKNLLYYLFVIAWVVRVASSCIDTVVAIYSDFVTLKNYSCHSYIHYWEVIIINNSCQRRIPKS